MVGFIFHKPTKGTQKQKQKNSKQKNKKKQKKKQPKIKNERYTGIIKNVNKDNGELEIIYLLDNFEESIDPQTYNWKFEASKLRFCEFVFFFFVCDFACVLWLKYI